MELLLTDEQRMLQDSAAKHFVQGGGVKRTRELRGKGGGYDRAAHVAMAQEGWLGIMVPEQHGGLSLGATELALVMMEAGRVLAPEPITAAAISAAAMAACPGVSPDDATLAAIMSGTSIVVPAFDLGGGGVQARAAGLEMVLDGKAVQVAHAQHADGFLVEAKVNSTGTVLCYADRSAPGLTVVNFPTVDGRDHGRIEFAKVRARPLTTPTLEGRGMLEPFFDLALVMASAELVGVMSAALDMTVEYLKIRHQFGKPIGSFQALQHRAVDDLTSIASTRSFLFQVAAQFAGAGDTLSPAMGSALKAHASGEALKVTKSAIQMHGGIGFTDEHDIGLYLKRAMWLSAWLGNEAHHRKRYMASGA